MCVCACACMCMYMCVCMYIYIYIYMQGPVLNTHFSRTILIHTYMRMYICMYIYIYIYTCMQGTVLNNLFSATDDMQFSGGTLFTYGFLYFVIAAFSVGTATPSGAFMPMMLVGSSFGRLVGLLVQHAVNGTYMFP